LAHQVLIFDNQSVSHGRTPSSILVLPTHAVGQ
jgi:hypothetical protein